MKLVIYGWARTVIPDTDIILSDCLYNPELIFSREKFLVESDTELELHVWTPSLDYSLLYKYTVQRCFDTAS